VYVCVYVCLQIYVDFSLSHIPTHTYTHTPTAILGFVTLQHKDAQKAVLHFLETFLQAGVPSSSSTHTHPPTSPATTTATHTFILSLLLPQGEALTHKLLLGLAGETPTEMVNDPEEASLCGILWRCVRICPVQHIQSWLHPALFSSTVGAHTYTHTQTIIAEPLATAEERTRFFEGVCSACVGVGMQGLERKDFFTLVSKFAWGCRDNARRLRRKGLGS
jgi:hypothetical protein